MQLQKWFSRKTSYGISTTVHAILFDEEKNRAKLFCRNAGSYKPETLVKKEMFEQKDQCPECILALKKAVTKRIQEVKK